MIKRETYLNQIRPFIGKDIVKVLTGIRRCGKSVMLDLIRSELTETGITSDRFLIYNFEDMRLAHLLTAEALHGEVSNHLSSRSEKTFLFFDEIQEVKDWEKCVNSLRVEYDCDIYITGSNATLLSGELATFLAGRYVEFVIYPFSFAEFIELYSSVFPGTSASDAFFQYLLFGGMPYLSKLGFQAEAAKIYLQDLYNSVVLKDIISRNEIRNIDLLERIITYAFANIGNSFSAYSISKYLLSEGRKIAPETVLNYLDYCAQAYLIHRVKRHDLKGKKLLTVNEKFYLADHGIREAVFGSNQQEINLVLENIVCMELLRRGYQVTVGQLGSREIDFVGKKQNETLYIQVAYLLASPQTVEREFGVFDAVKDNFPKFVLSMDELDMSQGGIRHVNLRDFLLMPSWT